MRLVLAAAFLGLFAASLAQNAVMNGAFDRDGGSLTEWTGPQYQAVSFAYDTPPASAAVAGNEPYTLFQVLQLNATCHEVAFAAYINNEADSFGPDFAYTVTLSTSSFDVPVSDFPVPNNVFKASDETGDLADARQHYSFVVPTVPGQNTLAFTLKNAEGISLCVACFAIVMTSRSVDTVSVTPVPESMCPARRSRRDLELLHRRIKAVRLQRRLLAQQGQDD